MCRRWTSPIPERRTPWPLARTSPLPRLHPKSGLPDFGIHGRPKSDKSDFGWRVREGAPLAHARVASPSPPSPASGGGSERQCTRGEGARVSDLRRRAHHACGGGRARLGVEALDLVEQILLSRSVLRAARRANASAPAVDDAMETRPAPARTTLDARIACPTLATGLRRAFGPRRTTSSAGAAPMSAARTLDLRVTGRGREQNEH